LAGQFEEHEERDTNDDADESKRWMIEHLDKIGKRESLQQAMNEQEQDAAG
jgi:hypothetical protein